MSLKHTRMDKLTIVGSKLSNFEGWVQITGVHGVIQIEMYETQQLSSSQ